jgi:hypothetical protein
VQESDETFGTSRADRIFAHHRSKTTAVLSAKAHKKWDNLKAALAPFRSYDFCRVQLVESDPRKSKLESRGALSTVASRPNYRGLQSVAAFPPWQRLGGWSPELHADRNSASGTKFRTPTRHSDFIFPENQSVKYSISCSADFLASLPELPVPRLMSDSTSTKYRNGTVRAI